MSGIVFFRTASMDAVSHFYTQRCGMTLWLDQGSCKIFRNDNLLLGFCKSDTADINGTITFFHNVESDVNEVYNQMIDVASSPPVESSQYKIYHFYTKDPEGRSVEFQSFRHPLPPFAGGDTLLKHRRSVRHFRPDPVPKHLVHEILNCVRFAPSARNTQGSYVIAVSNPEMIRQLASVRPGASEPIGRAPMAVVILANPAVSPRPVEDGDIAATYFMLAAAQYGLGTCWIGGMNRADVKDWLHVPSDHCIAMVSPLGYPAEQLPLPQRRDVGAFLHWVE